MIDFKTLFNKIASSIDSVFKITTSFIRLEEENKTEFIVYTYSDDEDDSLYQVDFQGFGVNIYQVEAQNKNINQVLATCFAKFINLIEDYQVDFDEEFDEDFVISKIVFNLIGNEHIDKTFLLKMIGLSNKCDKAAELDRKALFQSGVWLYSMFNIEEGEDFQLS